MENVTYFLKSVFFSSSAVHYQIKNTHREKAPSNKIQRLQKVRIWAFGSLVHQTGKKI